MTLTPGPPPDVTTSPPLGPIRGDWTDDDGRAIDDAFLPSPWGPVESEGLAYEREAIPTATRMLTRKVTIGVIGGVTYEPVQLFPADLNRKQLIIVTSDDISIGSDKTDVYQAATIPTGLMFSTDSHTGAVWVYSTEANAVYVSGWSVTS